MEASISAPELSKREGIAPAPQPGSTRLMSLDLFRGATIAAMILVNNGGEEAASYWPLKHAEWNGWTPTDLIFPFFVFIVGVAMAFSFRSRMERGESHRALLKHVMWRGLVILALGIFLNGFPNQYDFHTLRFYGVLQRIALCYVITGILELWTDWRTVAAVACACLLGYWALMRYVSVPGFGVPTHNIPILDPDANIVAWLDRRLLLGHLYEGSRDPEGLLSTIPALATCLLGLLTGKWLRSQTSMAARVTGMAAAGVVLVVLGELWNPWFPINKKLWTSSYVLLTAGLALLGLALCYWIADVKRWRGRWTRLLLVFGTNAIAAYFFAEVIAHALYRIQLSPGLSLKQYVYSHFFGPLASPANASLLYAVVFVAMSWLVMAVLYRRGILVKI